MRQYRIKQIDDNKYIPQTRKLMDVLMLWDNDWYSINEELQEVEDVDNDDWITPLTTMEQAEERIEKFKVKPIFPKYHPSK